MRRLIAPATLERILSEARRVRALVAGDLMLDRYLWGNVRRISPEAPVPVVELERETETPGGAANTARNLRVLGAETRVLGLTGKDPEGKRLRKLLYGEGIGCSGLIETAERPTSVKTRIVAGNQQVLRLDKEATEPPSPRLIRRLRRQFEEEAEGADAVILADYGKGVLSQELLDHIRNWCRPRAVWLSLDPKPVHDLDLSGLSLITPNRREAFELAGRRDGCKKGVPPLEDAELLETVRALQEQFLPAILLVTLGEQGMLLCRRGEPPRHIPTAAREVYDVSGAGDTVIAAFTLAIAAGASPLEAAAFSNLAAGVVVGKIGAAAAAPEELRQALSA